MLTPSFPYVIVKATRSEAGAAIFILTCWGLVGVYGRASFDWFLVDVSRGFIGWVSVVIPVLIG